MFSSSLKVMMQAEIFIWSAPAAGFPREHLAWGAVDGALDLAYVEKPLSQSKAASRCGLPPHSKMMLLLGRLNRNIIDAKRRAGGALQVRERLVVISLRLEFVCARVG